MIDDARFLFGYEKKAFGGGLMLSKIDPSTNTITIYNANDAAVSLDGVAVFIDSALEFACSGASSTTWTESGNDGELLSGETATTTDCTLDTTDAVRLVDAEALNSGGWECGTTCGDWDYLIDAVCWGTSADADCADGQPIENAGLWTAGEFIDGSGSPDYYQLKITGNNDDAKDDWEAIPEFSTLLMPIASVLMIVGYNYRRKNVPEA
jgi:hypothetical protein